MRNAQAELTLSCLGSSFATCVELERMDCESVQVRRQIAVFAPMEPTLMLDLHCASAAPPELNLEKVVQIARCASSAIGLNMANASSARALHTACARALLPCSIALPFVCSLAEMTLLIALA